jgi:aspartate-semialdehyde dehydrogenase
VEMAFAKAGKFVLSNAKNFRMEPDVPLVIPEVNGDHLGLIECQRRNRGWKGAIITNANCSATVAAVALAPLHQKFGIKKLFLSTLQAVSGAGYPGVPSLDILGNVIPFIADEEPKLERELLKLLGTYAEGEVTSASFKVSAHTNRVPVEHGHTICMTIGFEETPTPEQAIEAMRSWQGFPATVGLPTRPEHPLVVSDAPDRPQPKRDVNAGDGMTVTVGRVRRDAILDLRMVALGHNTIRGAAGGSVLNAELLASNGAFDSA